MGESDGIEINLEYVKNMGYGERKRIYIGPHTLLVEKIKPKIRNRKNTLDLID